MQHGRGAADAEVSTGSAVIPVEAGITELVGSPLSHADVNASWNIKCGTPLLRLAEIVPDLKLIKYLYFMNLAATKGFVVPMMTLKDVPSGISYIALYRVVYRVSIRLHWQTIDTLTNV